mgnify:CR=1 FL=1
MRITNPATGLVIAEVAADNLKTVRAKYELARAAQPKWSAVPIRRRIATLGKFRELLIERQDKLAKHAHGRGRQADPAIAQRAQGTDCTHRLLPRRNRSALRDEKVFADPAGKLEERIAHVPLGVIANISAWNYPYFVGGNVFVPALAAGNAVLYKPSEFATLTGQHIADLLHESGVPRDVFIAVIGDGATGTALLRQPVDGVFFTGSYRTGAKIAASTGRRMIKTQLELGGKDPIYVCEDVDVKAAAAGVADGAFYNTGQSCCSVERASTSTSGSTTHSSAAFVAEVKNYKVGDPQDETTYIGAITRKPQIARVEGAGGRREEERGEAVARRPRPPRQGQLVCADRPRRRRSLDARDARRVLRPDHRLAGRGRRRSRDRPHERHRIRPDGGCLLHQRKAREEDPERGERGQRLLELLRPGQPAPAVVRCQALGDRPDAIDLRHPDVHATQGLAPTNGVTAREPRERD